MQVPAIRTIDRELYWRNTPICRFFRVSFSSPYKPRFANQTNGFPGAGKIVSTHTENIDIITYFSKLSIYSEIKPVNLAGL
jgi:hypothetical protein